MICINHKPKPPNIRWNPQETACVLFPSFWLTGAVTPKLSEEKMEHQQNAYINSVKSAILENTLNKRQDFHQEITGSKSKIYTFGRKRPQ